MINNDFAMIMWKKWLKAIICTGENIIIMSQQKNDMDLISAFEHFFVISVKKSLDWGKEYIKVNHLYRDDFNLYLTSIPDATLVRNMREHDIDYFKGKGYQQAEFIKEFEINNGTATAIADGTSTIVCDEGYLIGGRLNVQHTIELSKKLLDRISK